MSQDVCVGDVLVGDDGTPRIVEELTQGEDELYKVTQAYGMHYVVNSKHKLVLKLTGNGTISWLKDSNCWVMRWFDNDEKQVKTKQIATSATLSKEGAFDLMLKHKHELCLSDSIEIVVDDYMKLPLATKMLLKGYKSGVKDWTSMLMLDTSHKDGLRTAIKVEHVGRGKYYGWKVDKNHRFVSPDLTVLRNCDQMWCTSCHTAFSWSTGQVVRGNIHNPHYYEYMRKQGQNAQGPREIGDIPCGGLPDYNMLRTTLSQFLQGSEYSALEPYHRVIGEVMDLRTWYRNRNLEDTRNIRVKYLLKDYDDNNFKRMLQIKAKAHEKVTNIDQVLDMFVMASSAILQRVRTVQNANEARMVFVELEELRKYMNESMTKVGIVYDCKTPWIDDALQLHKVGERKQW
jgi:hypothetical protein